MSSAPEPGLHEGWLLKEGHFAKNWKRRFFVLERGVLEYFESPEAKTTLGRIALVGASQARAPCPSRTRPCTVAR